MIRKPFSVSQNLSRNVQKDFELKAGTLVFQDKTYAFDGNSISSRLMGELLKGYPDERISINNKEYDVKQFIQEALSKNINVAEDSFLKRLYDEKMASAVLAAAKDLDDVQNKEHQDISYNIKDILNHQKDLQDIQKVNLENAVISSNKQLKGFWDNIVDKKVQNQIRDELFARNIQYFDQVSDIRKELAHYFCYYDSPKKIQELFKYSIEKDKTIDGKNSLKFFFENAAALKSNTRLEQVSDDDKLDVLKELEKAFDHDKFIELLTTEREIAKFYIEKTFDDYIQKIDKDKSNISENEFQFIKDFGDKERTQQLCQAIIDNKLKIGEKSGLSRIFEEDGILDIAQELRRKPENFASKIDLIPQLIKFSMQDNDRPTAYGDHDEQKIFDDILAILKEYNIPKIKNDTFFMLKALAGSEDKFLDFCEIALEKDIKIDNQDVFEKYIDIYKNKAPDFFGKEEDFLMLAAKHEKLDLEFFVKNYSHLFVHKLSKEIVKSYFNQERVQNITKDTFDTIVQTESKGKMRATEELASIYSIISKNNIKIDGNSLVSILLKEEKYEFITLDMIMNSISNKDDLSMIKQIGDQKINELLDELVDRYTKSDASSAEKDLLSKAQEALLRAKGTVHMTSQLSSFFNKNEDDIMHKIQFVSLSKSKARQEIKNVKKIDIRKFADHYNLKLIDKIKEFGDKANELPRTPSFWRTLKPLEKAIIIFTLGVAYYPLSKKYKEDKKDSRKSIFRVYDEMRLKGVFSTEQVKVPLENNKFVDRVLSTDKSKKKQLSI